MTVTQLIRTLERLKAKHGNVKVSVNVAEVENPNMRPECDIFHLRDAVAQWVNLADDDGGIAMTKAGRERGSVLIVLK